MSFGTKGSRWEDNPKGPLFTVRYDSFCRDCREDIEAGELAGYFEGDLLCEFCWDAA